MSYSANISFKTLDDGDVFSFFQKFKKATILEFDKLAEDNYIYSPFCRHPNKDQHDLLDEAIDWADRGVFKYRWFYLAEQKLLGIFGVPRCLEGLFDATIFFQNSCDQDYEYSTWKDVPLFAEIASYFENATAKEIEELCRTKWETELDISDEKRVLYFRKSFAYDAVWNIIGKYLDNEDEVTYISLFGNFYERDKLRMFAAKCGRISGVLSPASY